MIVHIWGDSLSEGLVTCASVAVGDETAEASPGQETFTFPEFFLAKGPGGDSMPGHASFIHHADFDPKVAVRLSLTVHGGGQHRINFAVMPVEAPDVNSVVGFHQEIATSTHKANWKEICVSEVELWGTPPTGSLSRTTTVPVQYSSAPKLQGIAGPGRVLSLCGKSSEP